MARAKLSPEGSTVRGVRLSIDQHKRMAELAHKNDRSLSAEIRRAVRLYLETAPDPAQLDIEPQSWRVG